MSEVSTVNAPNFAPPPARTTEKAKSAESSKSAQSNVDQQIADSKRVAEQRNEAAAQKAKSDSTKVDLNAKPNELAQEILESYIPQGSPNTKLRINKDEDTGLFVYQTIDKETGEVQRQFPPEEILKFIAYYRETEGLVVDDKA